MGHSGFQAPGEAIVVPVGQNAMRKLAIILGGGSATLDENELLAVAEEIDELEKRLSAALGAFREMEDSISGVGIVRAKERLISALKGISPSEDSTT